jgi:hypothetical protein
MRRIITILAATAALGFTACDEGTQPVPGEPSQVYVYDEDGKYDLRQVHEACRAKGMIVDTWIELGGGADVGALVTCRERDQ